MDGISSPVGAKQRSAEADSLPLTAEALSWLVKRHAHDLRNTLNGMEAELMLLAETGDAAEKSAAIKRLRQEMKCADGLIRSFASKFSLEGRSAIAASDLAAKWISDARALLPDSSITWDLKAGRAVIEVDAVLLRGVLSEMLVLSARRCPRLPLEARCFTEEGRVIFCVSGASPPSVAGARDPMDLASWSTLGVFAARGNGALERTTSPDNAHFSNQLTVPILPA